MAKHMGRPCDQTGQHAYPWTHIRHYLSAEFQQRLWREAETYPLSSPEVKVFGKWHAIPRRQVWFGDTSCHYKYSGLLVEPEPWPKVLALLRQRLQADFGLCSNGVLVNHYADGRDCMGWHSDNEAELVPDADIASVSLGAGRDFVLRHRFTGERIVLPLVTGDLLLMHAPMQQVWQHSLPKRLRLDKPRLNFTFRTLYPGFYADN